MNFELTASMMYAGLGNLRKEVTELEKSGIDSFHVDIMDGYFVPNFAMSINDMKCIASLATKPVDVHLMIEHPNEHIKLFLSNLRKGDTVYIHPEAEYNASTTLQKIIDAGMIPGIAINPGTSVETIMEMLQIVKKVLVIGTNPGYEGEAYLSCVDKKITKLIALKEDMDFEIYLEGINDIQKIHELAPKGVNGFVLGDHLLFDSKLSYGEAISKVRDIHFGESKVINSELVSFTNKKVMVG